ncbi:MAG: MaoC family dehydratase N-terminal domain-containing protein [Elusimicrobia bacterium]|nr:MaoC family dehydratase N-terminal domain-containing protein [Elusimicrobiota bacterium]
MGNSLYFEDYQVGASIKTSARTITQTDVVNFACLSGDFNPIHVNVEYAKKGVFGQPIAHGLLGLSVLTGLAHEVGFIRESVVAFTGLNWRFLKPVVFGDTIHGEYTVSKTRGLGPLQGLVFFAVKILNQRDEVVGEGEWSLMMKKKAPAAAAVTV